MGVHVASTIDLVLYSSHIRFLASVNSLSIYYPFAICFLNSDSIYQMVISLLSSIPTYFPVYTILPL